MLLRLRALTAAAATLLFSVQIATAQEVLPKGLLWRIDAPGAATAPSYLFGTIHLIDADDFLLSDSLLAVLNRVDRVFFEIDPGAMQDPMALMPLIQSAMMQDGTTLKTLLSDEEYGRVNDHFLAMGLPMMFLERIKPMFLSILASTDPGQMQGMMGGGSDDESAIKSYELELNTIAQGLEKPIEGLETMAFQMSLFDSIPYPAQAKMLMDAIDAPAGGEDPLTALTKVYVSGDIERMYAMSVGEDSGVADFEEMLLVNRNRNWVAPMKAGITAEPSLFAVGAGHLGGPQGVIRLLQAEGYTLTPISIR